MSDEVPEHVREQLRAGAARNSYLLSLLPTDFSEPFSDDQLTTVEVVAAEIQANLRDMLRIADSLEAQP